MGPRLKLPPYVHAFVDRHGKARFYFRRLGFGQTPLPGLPWSPQFMDAYEQAKAGARVEIGAARTAPGTIAALVVAYFNSAAFHSLAPASQQTRRRITERIRVEHGDKRVALLQREHIERMLTARIGKPVAALNWLITLRVLMQFAVRIGMRRDDPTRDVKRPKVKTEGYATWSEEDIAAFENKHPVGTRARLALALLLYTAQRRADIVRMGRQHMRDGVLHVRQQKTGANLAIPVHATLQAILDATPSGNMTFLTTMDGTPFTAAGFGNFFRARCREASLSSGLSAHGLRKAACRRLAEAGCTVHEIMSISGHASLKEVQRYTAAVDQARMARAAMAKTRLRTSIGKLE